jgi:hypothetical protein
MRVRLKLGAGKTQKPLSSSVKLTLHEVKQ